MSDPASTALRTTLQKAGYSITASRRTVYGALRNQEPLSMRELVERCESIDRASVYRSVQLFERLGIVQRLQTGWKYKLELHDQFHDHHHHATCLQCDTTFVMPEDAAIEELLQAFAGTIGFTLTGHQLELSGYCADCSKTAETSATLLQPE